MNVFSLKNSSVKTKVSHHEITHRCLFFNKFAVESLQSLNWVICSDNKTRQCSSDTVCSKDCTEGVVAFYFLSAIVLYLPASWYFSQVSVYNPFEFLSLKWKKQAYYPNAMTSALLSTFPDLQAKLIPQSHFHLLSTPVYDSALLFFIPPVVWREWYAALS